MAFPAFLYSSSRFGIMAQAQLDDDKTCDRELIGTGPFKFEEWSPNDKLVGSRNEDYWQIAPRRQAVPLRRRSRVPGASGHHRAHPVARKSRWRQHHPHQQR